MAQTVGHLDVDLEKIGVDVGVFSGHKMFALESVGCLYINHRLHSLIQQVDFGGGMQSNQFPYSFELGTKNTVGILSLKAAVEFINKAGIENISTHINELSQYLLKAMNRIKHTIEFEPGIAYDKNLNNTGILAFNLIDHEQSKVNFYLAKGNINIRNGDHCRNQDPSLRISLHCYNSFSDIDKLISVLDKIS
jgi:cysteine desulfurase/selenocysteine lyase